MVDLSHLSHLPEPPFTTGLQSSHNPRSDTATPGDADWHADQDYINPADGQEMTLLDLDGPGVLTRIWSASPSGTVRIFLDDATEPAIEGDLADLLSGAVGPFHAPFAFIAAYGHNLYFPISFSDRCRVVLTGAGAGPVYFHIAYRRYPEGAQVEPFGPDALAAARCTYDAVAEYLRAPVAALPPVADEVHTTFELDSGSGEALVAVLEAPDGGGILRELRLSPSSLEPGLLRSTRLIVEVDGERTVAVPLLDFFAMGFEAAQVRSLPVQVDDAGVLTSRWPMPFAERLRIWIEQTTDSDLQGTLDLIMAPERWTDQSLLFYAGWHPPIQLLSKPAHDHTLAEATGQGYFVGNTLNVVNPSSGWWGEGDERIYVDGEDFPSHFGTGTEDYYGYAWCSNDLFSLPYIGQTASTSHRSFGRASFYRFHVLDPIPFDQALRFDLEVRHWGDPVEITYDSVSMWYARPGAVIIGTDTADSTFWLPWLDADPPEDVEAGPYRCGG